jgi:hypothetical protein
LVSLNPFLNQPSLLDLEEQEKMKGNEEVSFFFSLYSVVLFLKRGRGCFCSIYKMPPFLTYLQFSPDKFLIAGIFTHFLIIIALHLSQYIWGFPQLTQFYF